MIYIGLGSGHDQDFVQLLCGYEISLRLLVVYWWFNTFFINVHFRNSFVLTKLTASGCVLGTSWSITASG